MQCATVLRVHDSSECLIPDLEADSTPNLATGWDLSTIACLQPAVTSTRKTTTQTRFVTAVNFTPLSKLSTASPSIAHTTQVITSVLTREHKTLKTIDIVIAIPLLSLSLARKESSRFIRIGFLPFQDPARITQRHLEPTASLTESIQT